MSSCPYCQEELKFVRLRATVNISAKVTYGTNSQELEYEEDYYSEFHDSVFECPFCYHELAEEEALSLLKPPEG